MKSLITGVVIGVLVGASIILTGAPAMRATVIPSVSVTVSPSGAATRDPALRPFAFNSPWNYPIGTGATYAAVNKGNGPSGRTSGGFRTCSIQGSARYATYVYVATASDPLAFWTDRTRTSSGGPTFVFNTNRFQRRIPPAALGSNLTGEGRVVVITPDHLTSMEGGNLSLDGLGGFTSPSYGGVAKNVDLKGNGMNFNTMAVYYGIGDEALPTPTSNPRSGTTALKADAVLNTIGASLLGGLIRAGELANGIPHALRIVPPNIYWNRNPPGGNSWVWPANSSDDPTPYGIAGNLYFGGLLALPPSFNVATLTTVQGQNIALAFKNYGGYGCASTTTGSVGTDTLLIFMESNAVQNGEIPGSAAFATDLNTIAAALQVVTNSHHNGGPVVGGIKLDGGDGTVNPALVVPSFGLQWGSGR